MTTEDRIRQTLGALLVENLSLATALEEAQARIKQLESVGEEKAVTGGDPQ